MGSLNDKVAIITGAASGVGRATAQLFAKRGARVVVADILEDGGRETAEIVQQSGGHATFVKVDLALGPDIQNLISVAMSAYGRIDILHNNAAILRTHEELDQASVEEWRWILEVDLTSIFVASRLVAPIMRAQGGGVIVNTASMGGLIPYPEGLAYGAAKAGVISLTRSLAMLLEPDGIRVNCICPAGIDTPILRYTSRRSTALRAQRGVLQPREVGEVAEYLATEESLTGASILVRREGEEVCWYRIKDYAVEAIDQPKEE
jgi:NAD(P)-dependent dehydrogenase (short-subunit alcohol dehydrogenase family)